MRDKILLTGKNAANFVHSMTNPNVNVIEHNSQILEKIVISHDEKGRLMISDPELNLDFLEKNARRITFDQNIKLSDKNIAYISARKIRGGCHKKTSASALDGTINDEKYTVEQRKEYKNQGIIYTKAIA